MKTSLHLLLLAFLGLASPAWAQFGGAVSHLRPKLVADTTAVQAGKPFQVGIVIELDPGWHTYWEYPGEYGLPVTAAWQLPPGFAAGPLRWPLPEKEVDGDDASYIYAHDVMLLVEITPPATLPPGETKLTAKLGWQVCEKTCVPGDATVDLQLPSGGSSAPANTELFQKWEAQLPQTGAPPFTAAWKTTAKDLLVTLEHVPEGATLDFYPLPPKGTIPGVVKVAAASPSGAREIRAAVEERSPAAEGWRGLVVLEQSGKRTGWMIAASATAGAAAPAASAAPVAPPSAPATPAAETRSLARLLFFAFVGGLILNVMPCVLPVIALKIFGFVRQAGHEPRRVFHLGLAFVAGVFTFFLGLATAVVILKAAGKPFNLGFQFQDPYLLAGLVSLVFVFALNLLGVFEVTLASGTSSTMSELSSREGFRGAFLHGLFTTLLGTSCTAPFLATSLGYAVTQPAPVVYLIFVTVAAGMSLPYFLLTARPAWLKYLPKPGAWMDRFKQIMGFIMLAVAVWLFTVFAGRGPEAVTSLSWFLLVLAVACWILGTLRRRGMAWGLALLLASVGYFSLVHGRLQAAPVADAGGADPLAGGIAWQPFSEQKLVTSVERGEPVFIDFTASWCWNCHLFERTVLARPNVQAAFRDRKVTMLRADWSNGDPEVTRWLSRFQRVGVPVYVLYRPGEAQPVVMDGLTQQTLLSHLSRIK